MFRKNPGLAIVETIMVIAISGLLFAVVIGTFATRRKAAADDAARQVMSQIALLRNQAQQGYAPVSPAAGNELFGVAVVMENNLDKIKIRYLQQNTQNGIISSFSDVETNMPAQLKWYINTSTAGFTSDYCASGNNFNSCYDMASVDSSKYFLASPVWLVFRNGSGQSYELTGSEYASIANYTSLNQSKVRFAFAIPGSGLDIKTQFDNASAKYFANFDLSTPGSQDLTVVK